MNIITKIYTIKRRRLCLDVDVYLIQPRSLIAIHAGLQTIRTLEISHKQHVNYTHNGK